MAYKSLAHKILDYTKFEDREIMRLHKQTCRIRKENGWSSISSRLLHSNVPVLGKLFNALSKNTFHFKDLSMTRHYAPQVKKAMKLRPAPEVLDAVEKMIKKNQDTLIKALEYTRLPYDDTWLEFRYKDITYGILAQERKTDEGKFAGLELRLFYDYDYKNMDTAPFTDLAAGKIVTQNGIEIPDNVAKAHPRAPENRLFNWITNKSSQARDQAMSSHMEQNSNDKNARIEIKLALSTLLLLNSRSGIIKIQENRNKHKKAGDRKFDTIEFDIDRIMRESKYKIDPNAAKAQLAEALVTGHFKLRKTGVFWWSPHLRNKRKGVDAEVATAEQLQRERIPNLSDPEANLHLPTAE